MRDVSPPPPGIDPLNWAETPQAARILVLARRQRVVTPRERVGTLEERTRKTSRNSPQPPTSDPPSTPVQRTGKRSVGKQEGQRGHRGQGRPLVPPERVDAVIDATLSACSWRGHQLLGEDPQLARHQVTEVPPWWIRLVGPELRYCQFLVRSELSARKSLCGRRRN